MTQITVLSVFGTRPEAIKMAPVVRELASRPEIRSRVCVTAQHRGLLDDVLRLFQITPDYDLNVMRARQSPTGVAAAVLGELEAVLKVENPDWVLVHGDTTTAAAAAIAAFYGGARIGHVEAGLRSHVPREPFPEEVNRRLVAVTADLHFAPTERARENLLAEGHAEVNVLVTGNSVIDALRCVADMPFDPATGPLASIPADRRIILLTAHRRENFGAPLDAICDAVLQLSRRYADDCQIVFPMHPNPLVREAANRWLADVPNITLLEPVGYRELVYLLERATIVLTDSGGIQEEAPGLGKPVLVLRDVTERPEGVLAGTVKVVGTRSSEVFLQSATLLDDPVAYAAMSNASNPYGDGHAAPRMADALLARSVDLHSVLPADSPSWLAR